jgi:HipA-like kinase
VRTGEPAKIVKVNRRMRGGSQSFLVRASDGYAYVAKFTGNPQGNRTLINECIANHLLSALNVATPHVAVLQLSGSCEGREQLYFSTDRHEPIRDGLHLGSKCPIDPDAAIIFDFLPRQLHSRVANLYDASIVFAFDCWAGHTDKRQFVFTRGRAGKNTSASKPGVKALLTAWAIDNGQCFAGNWDFSKFVPPTSHSVFEIYSHCNLEQSALAGAKMIQELPATVIQSSHRQIPRDWFAEGDEEALAVMLRILEARQHESVAIVREQVSAMKYRPRLAS